MTGTTARYASLAEVYDLGSYAPFRRDMRPAGSAPVALVRFAQPAGAFPDPPTPDFTLALNEQGTGRMSFDIGTGRIAVPFRPGDLVLKPPSVATHFAVDAPHRKSFISLPATLVGRITRDIPGFEGAAPDLGVLHGAPFRSAQVVRLLQAMWEGPPGDSPEHRMFGDALVTALVALLLGLVARHGTPRRSAALAPAHVSAVIAFVQGNLAESFGLEEMAACVGLSTSHFCRAFKAATGLTPRAFVTARRVEQARQLLRAGELPLAQVAQACGFADQAHLTTVFSRHTGVTPGLWRKRLA